MTIEQGRGDAKADRYWEVIENEESMVNPDEELCRSRQGMECEEAKVGDIVEEPLQVVIYGCVDDCKANHCPKMRVAEREEEVKSYQQRLGNSLQAK